MAFKLFHPLFFFTFIIPLISAPNFKKCPWGQMFNYTHKCIMKTFNGIMMVALTAMFCVFCGCSQDEDDYNNSDMYTLAEEMETRGMGGDPGGNQGKKKKKIDFVRVTGDIPNPKKNSNSTIPALYGEYDTDTLAVSVSNYVGLAKIYVAQGSIVLDSIITNVPSGCPSIFSLAGYTIGETYHADVVLGSDKYIGDFDL